VGVTGYVGLPRSGKTLRLTEIGLRDRKEGRDVYANFALGDRYDGYVVPLCSVWGGYCLGEWVHGTHEPSDWVFEPASAAIAERAGRYQLRTGRGFIKYPNMTVLESWEQVIALRVARDVFGVAHRLRLERGSDVESEDGIEQHWEAVPTCRWYTCNGCSKGITILLDELNGWAPARLWQKLGVGVMNRWSYSGKDGLDIHWSAQHPSFVDKYAREVTNFIWHCWKMGPEGQAQSFVKLFGIPLVLFRRDKWTPALMTDAATTGEASGQQSMSPKRPMAGETATWWSLGKVADHYDTYERVAQIEIGKGSRKLKAVRSA
jgi:hypothetical protein